MFLKGSRSVGQVGARRVAKSAAGALVLAVLALFWAPAARADDDAMAAGRAGETVFSLMRPPGHHATREASMGFCYLNNIAIAALEAVSTGIKRVAVFDFDVHHGKDRKSVV